MHPLPLAFLCRPLSLAAFGEHNQELHDMLSNVRSVLETVKAEKTGQQQQQQQQAMVCGDSSGRRARGGEAVAAATTISNKADGDVQRFFGAVWRCQGEASGQVHRGISRIFS